MARDTISHVAFELGVEQLTNVPGVMTPILRITTPQKETFLYPHGGLIMMELRDAANNHLPDDTRILISALRPGMDEAVQIDRPGEYRRWRGVSFQDQQNDRQNQRLRLQVPGRGGPAGGLRVEELEELLVKIRSSEVVDWDLSHFEIEFQRLGRD